MEQFHGILLEVHLNLTEEARRRIFTFLPEDLRAVLRKFDRQLGRISETGID